jgi:hypothetical protein
VTPLTPPYAHGVLIFVLGTLMLMPFSHAHALILCEHEGIAQRETGVTNSKTTIWRRWRTQREGHRGTRRQNDARIDEREKGRTNGSRNQN